MLNLRLKPYAILSGITAVLTLIAAPTGLLVPNFYNVLPSEDLLPGTYAQDLIAIVVARMLLWGVWAALVTAVYLWQKRDWGFVFAGVFLVKISTMGWALVIGTLFAQAAGTPIDWGQMVVYLFIATVGAVGMWRYLAHLRPLARETAVNLSPKNL